MSEPLFKILADTLELPLADVNSDLQQSDVDTWDSQRHLELIMNIETTFHVELQLSDVVRMRSVADILNILAQRAPG